MKKERASEEYKRAVDPPREMKPPWTREIIQDEEKSDDKSVRRFIPINIHEDEHEAPGV